MHRDVDWVRAGKRGREMGGESCVDDGEETGKHGWIIAHYIFRVSRHGIWQIVLNETNSSWSVHRSESLRKQHCELTRTERGEKRLHTTDALTDQIDSILKPPVFSFLLWSF
jgi:hypothetical protein